MIHGFWKKLNKPFFVLAPMADVTDIAFRQIIAKYSRHGKKGGGPDVFWTEFVSADGLCSAGQKKLLIDLSYSKKEKPTVAQLFSSNPKNMEQASKLCAELGFDGIDINMGCPDKSIEKQNAGAAMMKNPALAREIIRSAKRGVELAGKKIPVSVKTRLGYHKNESETWIPEILKEGLPALTIHGRTRKEMSLVPARWDDIEKVVKLVKKLSPETLVIGNGDVKDLVDAHLKAEQSGVDGVMIGRAIFGNPWLYDTKRNQEDISIEEKLKVLIEHIKLFEKLLGKHKNPAVMKKHFKAYVNGFDGAKELRIKLMEAGKLKEAVSILKSYLKK
jgi:nifR3 family TIM-barrel protein